MISIKNLRYEKPSNPYDIKVCRGKSVLGNPFMLTSEKFRDNVCDMYATWFYESTESLLPELRRIAKVYETYGKLNLFCWCVPKRCHAETIRDWVRKEGRG
jgi:hypothetical protein